VEERELAPVSLTPEGRGVLQLAPPPSAAAAAGGAVGAAESDAGGWERPLIAAAAASSSSTATAAAAEPPPLPSGISSGSVGKARLVVFASNSAGSRAYAVITSSGSDIVASSRSRVAPPAGAPRAGALTEKSGEVYVLRGLMTSRKVAGSVVAFLQHLLS